MNAPSPSERSLDGPETDGPDPDGSDPEGPGAQAAVSVRDLVLRRRPERRPYAEPTLVLDRLSFDAPAGQVTAVVGSNGAGKSTVLGAILGAIPSQAGSIRVLGSPMTGAEDALPAAVAFVADAPVVPDSWSAHDLARLCRGAVDTFDVREFGRLLRTHGVPASRKVRDLSRGQATWLGVAAALAGAPRLLILDEPLARLDPLARRELVDLLRERVAEGASVLLSTHDLDGMDRFVDHLVVLDHGRTVLEGDVESLREDHLLVSVPDLSAAAIGPVAIGAERLGEGTQALVRVDDAAGLPAGADLRTPDLADLVTAYLRDAGRPGPRGRSTS